MTEKRPANSTGYAQLAVASAKEAIEDSGIDLEKINKNRVGVIYTSGIGGIRTFEDEMRAYDAEKGPKFNPFFIPKMIADIAAGQISMIYGFHGPNFATVSACASSTNPSSTPSTTCVWVWPT